MKQICPHGLTPRALGEGAPARVDENREPSLTDAFRLRSRLLHADAERSGIIQELLRGRATRNSYALLLRNLLPAYQQMEQGLDALRPTPLFDGLAEPALYRAAAIGADLEALCGPTWAKTLPLLPAGRCYADRVAAVAKGDGHRLIAHAYVRYLGDLNGGQVLKRLLGRTLALAPEALTFYDFPGIADLGVFKTAYREALDRSGRAIPDIAPVIEEAAEAFALNIRVSEAVQAASQAYGAVSPTAVAPTARSAFEPV